MVTFLSSMPGPSKLFSIILSTLALFASHAYGQELQVQSATRLENGDVLVLGNTQAKLFALKTREWLNVSVPKSVGIIQHSAVIASDGAVIITGGQLGNIGCITENSIWRFDVHGMQWQRIGAMKYSRQGHATVLLPGGKLLVSGGYRVHCENKDILEQDVLEVEMCSISNGICNVLGRQDLARSFHSVISLPNNQVMLIGGASRMGHGGPSQVPQIYDLQTNTFTDQLPPYPILENDPNVLELQDGRVLVIGMFEYGKIVWPTASKTASGGMAFFDAINRKWSHTRLNDLPAKGRAAVRLPGGDVLISGGAFAAYYAEVGLSAHRPISTDLFRLNPATGAVHKLMNIKAARAFHSMFALSDREVLLIGGIGNVGRALPFYEVVRIRQ